MLQDGGAVVPSSLDVPISDGALLQASLDMVRRPSVNDNHHVAGKDMCVGFVVCRF
jgi:hypothetical protein